MNDARIPEMARKFDERFVMEHNNIPGQGPIMLFRINPDGSRSIALAEDVKAFIAEIMDRRQP